MASNLQKLEKFQDALKEVGNIGAGRASSALSKLINQEVRLNPPEIYLSSLKDIPDIVGGPKKLVVGLYTAVSGEVSGTVLVVFPTKEALLLADILAKRKTGVTKILEKNEQLELRKAGQALSTSYLKTITEFLELKVKYANTRIISTFGESLTDFVLLGIEEQYAILLKTTFTIPNTEIKGDFILLLAIDSLTTLIQAIAKKV